MELKDPDDMTFEEIRYFCPYTSDAQIREMMSHGPVRANPDYIVADPYKEK